MRTAVRLVAVSVALVVGVRAIGRDREASADAPESVDAAPDASMPAGARAVWTDADWAVFVSKVRWAREEGLEALAPGETVGRLARSFVGTPYTPGTLEADGPERLVIDFREFDCVTFVENMLAMTRFIRSDGADLLGDPERARATYEGYLMDLRYRGGRLDGYPSRLHYFSEWLSDNAARGLVTPVTPGLDPALDSDPIDFMSTHADAYRQLADPGVRAAIGEMEARLNGAGPRAYVPQERIASVADRIQTGDVIAATSTVPGLDVAHTGLALWIDGRLHMVHAPLVGRSVEVSDVPLAERIVGISGQDGIMVARPVF